MRNHKYNKQSMNNMNMNVRGRGMGAKSLIIGWFLVMLVVFGVFIDYIVNTAGGVQSTEPLPDYLYIFINPLKSFFSLFGEVVVTDAWLAYAFGMFAMWLVIFFGFFILTGNPRFLILGTALSLLAVPVEDYIAHLADGRIWPVWEGPIKGLGFINNIPTFYYIFFVPGLLLLLVWFFWEHRLNRVYKGVDNVQRGNVFVFNFSRNKRRIK